MTLPKELTTVTPLSKTLALLLFITLPILGFFFGMKYQKLLNTNNDANPIINKPIYIAPTSIPTQFPFSSPEAGLKQYFNNTLKYGFKYPADTSLYECPADVPCLSIDKLSLRVEPLETFYLLPYTPKESLMKNDLYCDASGPTGSIVCENTEVEDFTNSLNLKGYKVFRTKTVTGSGGNISPGIYKDYAYAFPLQNVVRDGNLKFAGILFAVDNPIESNHVELDQIANSFFYTK